MKRAALMPVLLCSLVLCCVLLGGIRTASADAYDLVVFDGVFGGTVSKFNGQRKWQPTLWLDGSYGVAGPLHIGGYFQWLGKSWPLDDPGFGGGAVLALRGNIKSLRLSGAFAGGYLGVPLVTHVEGTGTVGAFAGLGYGFLDWLGLEVRGRWTRYFKMPPGAPNHAWSIEAGLSFFIN
ncbi:MAG: hypothetical protein GQ551_09300 [Myxococcales bacterium]|nr:hypothetical protein [Myxococcales bacterium]